MDAAERSTVRNNVFNHRSKRAIEFTLAQNGDAAANGAHGFQRVLQKRTAIEHDGCFVLTHACALAAGKHKSRDLRVNHCTYQITKLLIYQLCLADFQSDNPAKDVQLKAAAAFQNGVAIEVRNGDKNFFIHHAGGVRVAQVFQQPAPARALRNTESQISEFAG